MTQSNGSAPAQGNCDIGLIGLAVMGQNLVLNMESKGFSVGVYNRTSSVTQKLVEDRFGGKNIVPSYTTEEFVNSLASPRKIMIMVKAGAPVDAVIDGLLPYLDKGDLLIDGGNSLFTDTVRREKDLKEKGFLFIGTGVSGGEEGALHGPSLMPGGATESYALVKNIFQTISAQVPDENKGTAPCCTYIGPNGAGHYVKMVHNGIEYGDMQLICEAYALLRDVLGMEAPELHDVFTQWNKGDLDSYLVEITADIFSRQDPKTGGALVDVILDKAGQKGTGKWTLQSALDLGIVTSTINAAVEARVLSSKKDERVRAAQVLPAPEKPTFDGDRAHFIEAVRNALYASKIISYAQGLDLLRAASDEYEWNLSVGEIASIWRGGCIIRAVFLNRITEAYGRNATLRNLTLDTFFTDALTRTQADWREVVATSARYGVAVPAFAASLAYFDGYRAARGPQNLLQAQRDYFGAHTYERVDEPGTFHTDWIETEKGETPDCEPAIPPATP